ncbi:methylaspartate mutase [Actinokineospora sp. NBRC 105648]|uniref:methylaspartate mutase n=1 Tax=Actinokineospora sp. NBRC 105648 TaxID=3032206 RepID=UPI0024A0F5C4|nr:methylaspartate mutase [Actinokineospora sp. NBRC 105648]GLZ39384.1 methylaspartate mutase [Actinokineospora sp. NBRC 105648]
MLGEDVIELDRERRQRLPSWSEIVDGLRSATSDTSDTAVEVLKRAKGRPVLQPRCGVGGHAEMLDLLRALESAGAPDLLSVTIDSHTRLRHFATADRVRRENPAQLNGYPLVAHGWERGRELVAAVGVPLQVRHGSPDGRDLFAVSLAAGITSFEGGGIGYNIPYAKDVPLADSLRAWQQVDAVTAELARSGVVLERELFGSLTAVLVPPSLSLAMTLLEAVLAAEQGVRCVSISYPQSGEVHQDVAALRAIRAVAAEYLPADMTVFTVLHEFMGVFPAGRDWAEALVHYGGLVGRLGGADKVITKTHQEALGIPTAAANAHGLRLARAACSPLLDFVRLDEGRVAEEQHWIEREVAELVTPVLERPRLATAVEAGFAAGTLDIPFSASVHARADVVPLRDPTGAIRYHAAGALPLSGDVLRRQHRLLSHRTAALTDEILADINYFADRPPWTAEKGQVPA